LQTEYSIVHRSTFVTWAYSVASPTVCNSLPDSLCDPAVEYERFRHDLKRISLPHIRDMSALGVTVLWNRAIQIEIFHLLTYNDKL